MHRLIELAARSRGCADQSLNVAVFALRSVVAATLKFGNCVDRRLDHLLEVRRVDVREVLVEPLDLEAEAGGEVLLVADHHVDVLRDVAVDLLRAFLAALALPERRAVVEVVRDDGAVLAARPPPPRCTASDVFGASAAKMPPVWNQRTPSSPNSFSQFTSPGLICEAAEWPRSEQPSAGRMPKPFSVKLRPTRVLRPEAVEVAPDDVRHVDAALHDEVLDEPAEVVLRQRGDDGGALLPALPHRARDVVLAAAFPHLEAARVAHAAEAGVEAQHHLAERHAVPLRLGGGPDLRARPWSFSVIASRPGRP